MRSQWSVALIIMYHHNLYHLMFVRHACAPLYIFHGGKKNINTVWHCAFAEWTVRESSSVHVKCMTGERETSLKAERAVQLGSVTVHESLVFIWACICFVESARRARVNVRLRHMRTSSSLED